MVDLSYLIMIIVIALCFIFAIKAISKILKFVFIAMVFIAIIITLSAVFVRTDINNFKENIDRTRLFLLSDEGRLEAAFTTRFAQKEVTEDKGILKTLLLWNPADFSKDRIIQIDPKSLQIDFEEKNYAKLNDNHYRIYIIEAQAIGLKGLSGNYSGNAELFAAALASNMQKDDCFLMKQYKKSRITPYPKTAAYRLTSLLPTFLAERLIK